MLPIPIAECWTKEYSLSLTDDERTEVLTIAKGSDLYDGWTPYCMKCDTIGRMRTHEFGFKCKACLNEIGWNLRAFLVTDEGQPPKLLEHQRTAIKHLRSLSERLIVILPRDAGKGCCDSFRSLRNEAGHYEPIQVIVKLVKLVKPRPVDGPPPEFFYDKSPEAWSRLSKRKFKSSKKKGR